MSERLNREPTLEEVRKKDLTARENKLTCKEFVGEHKYPAALLELFDTSDADKFKTAVENLYKAFPQLAEDPGKTPIFVAPTHGKFSATDAIAQAFKPKF